MSGPSYDPSDFAPPGDYVDGMPPDIKGYPKKVIIKCPEVECGEVQPAEIHFFEGDPFETYLHTCSACGYEIGEDEWNEIAPDHQEKPR